MSKQAFVDPLLALAPSLPLTPASLLWKEQKLVNFSSHDYLGLSQHAEMRKNAIKYLLHYGTGICHPEIKNGYLECQRNVEEKCAEALGVRCIELFSTRSLALSALLQQFFDARTALFMDAACQAPLMQWEGSLQLFAHRNLNALDTQLSTCSQHKRLIFSESLFGTTGHSTDIDALILLAKKHNAYLLIDDTFAFGVKGKQGFGLASQCEGIDFVLCGLDCGAGASGAFISCPYRIKDLSLPREYALSFSSLGAIEAALELIPTFEGERMQLEQRAHWIRGQLKAAGIPLAQSSSHLIALACSSLEEAHHLWKRFLDDQLLSEIHCVQQQAYLVFAINTHHNPEELSLLTQSFQKQ
ncbi:MAG TPA: aminotransferase class I/II-fold pyridoxal phosphate-dependent enzyme [Rhabdochlamydiaceae bacterium]|jgi:8-amino-7-oxononanoate synthase